MKFSHPYLKRSTPAPSQIESFMWRQRHPGVGVLLREKDVHSFMSSYRVIHSWAAAHMRGTYEWAATHVQKKKVMSICSYIGVLMHEQLLMCRKNTLMSSCSYRGTHAWAATNVQKKWYSWTADHRGGVLMHEQLLMCRKNKWHSGVAAHIQGYLCMSSYSCAEKNDTHEQLLKIGDLMHRSSCSCAGGKKNGHEQLHMSAKWVLSCMNKI